MPEWTGTGKRPPSRETYRLMILEYIISSFNVIQAVTRVTQSFVEWECSYLDNS